MARENTRGVQITFPAPLVLEMRKKFPEDKWVKDSDNSPYRIRDEVSVFYNQMSEACKEFAYQALRESGDRGIAGALTSLRNAEKDPANSSVANLKVLAQVIGEYVKKDAINGWLYTRTEHGDLKAWLVTNVEYEEATQESPASVTLCTVANKASLSRDGSKAGGLTTDYHHFNAGSLGKKKVAEILAATGLMKETKELREEYDAYMAKFNDYIKMEDAQFRVKGVGTEVNEGRWYSSNQIKIPVGTKMVQDEGFITRKFYERAVSPFWEFQGCDFSSVPTHPDIFMFNLDTHTNMWIHVNNMTPYVYDKTLTSKLVLPSDHRDLIDILTQDMDVLLDDIIEGKSGGTTVLCKGGPGLGKTLTAEVYSEIMEKPLYKVHSGQLGVTSATVEKSLTDVLQRAERWGAVVLIDEADVYIRKRGNDIDHNAVVASFLRTLEYFGGLLFMTTNRSDDVDDAIVSRCIATISYLTPVGDEAFKIWTVLSEQFQLHLLQSVREELVLAFPTASGRDMKELLKLVSKWCRRKQVEPSLKVFKQCAQFRGL